MGLSCRSCILFSLFLAVRAMWLSCCGIRHTSHVLLKFKRVCKSSPCYDGRYCGTDQLAIQVLGPCDRSESSIYCTATSAQPNCTDFWQNISRVPRGDQQVKRKGWKSPRNKNWLVISRCAGCWQKFESCMCQEVFIIGICTKWTCHAWIVERTFWFCSLFCSGHIIWQYNVSQKSAYITRIMEEKACRCLFFELSFQNSKLLAGLVILVVLLP